MPDNNDQLNENVEHIATDFGELALDTVLDEGLLRDIPIVGTLASLVRIVHSIPDRLFRRKVQSFLIALPDISPDEKQRFINDMQADPPLRRKVGDVLALLLDRFNDLDKPQMLAIIFTAYIRKYISFEQLRRLGQAIDLAFIDDLQHFQLVWDPTPTRDQVNAYVQARHNLLRSGLTELTYKTENPASRHRMRTWQPQPRRGEPSTLDLVDREFIVDTQVTISSLGELYLDLMAGRIPRNR